VPFLAAVCGPGRDAYKPRADQKGFIMKLNQTSSPQMSEPRNEKTGRKKRFLIIKLEERIAPCGKGFYKKHPGSQC
jgi:hypothetical protein